MLILMIELLGSHGTVLGIRVSSTNLLNVEILVLFDDPKAGNSRKIKNGPFKGARFE